MQATSFRFFKWLIVFYLSFWLFYDVAWWAIVINSKPLTFDPFAFFYFSIIVPETPYWFFFLVAGIGALIGATTTRVRKSMWLLPPLLYLMYIYMIGAISEVISIPPVTYVYYSLVFIPLILTTIILIRVRNKNVSDVGKLVLRDHSFIDSMSLGHLLFGIVAGTVYALVSRVIDVSVFAIPVLSIVIVGWEFIEHYYMKIVYLRLSGEKEWSESWKNVVSDLIIGLGMSVLFFYTLHHAGEFISLSSIIFLIIIEHVAIIPVIHFITRRPI